MRTKLHDSLRVLPRHVARVVAIGLDEPALDALRLHVPDAELQVLAASPVEQAGDRLLELQPDLLLVSTGNDDLLELVTELKALPETHFVPVFGIGEPDSHLAGYRAGVDRCLRAPHGADVDEELLASATSAIRSTMVARAVRDSRQELRLRRDWSRFLAHDLRNLLTSALGTVEVLLRSQQVAVPLDPAQQRELLSDAETQLWRAARLLNDLLDVDRVQKGVLQVHQAPTDLVLLTRGVAERFRTVAREAEVDILLRAPATLVADVEATLIDRVVTNLVDNAIQHAPARTVVDLLVRTDAEAATAILEVTNRGPGIPKERVHELFQPFVRLEESRRRAGVGLGLAFCRLATEVHGGTIDVIDAPGGGATFRVTLPCTPSGLANPRGPRDD